ncbi:MAG TPA: NADH-quinone oxidoreductase subunit L [Alphaproteobacteria bacterium]|nr:NADH-quinone oxidoreductase subunit L [Alphaproteobacteria bacterium]
MQTLATLTILLPGLGALVAALLAYTMKGKAADLTAQTLTTAAVIAAAIGSWVLFFNVGSTTPAFSINWFDWMTVANWQVSFGALVDRLTTTMLIVVTTVSACVHVYSWGYMEEDPSKRRFFIYLSVFTFAMLMLVSATNLVQMFLGWEGVGVCSYLLIGFWHQKESANAAAMKAFIVNRVADVAMLLGMFMVLQTFGSLTYADILPRAADMVSEHQNALNLMALFIFIGAMGKSAQFGLHTWLPDAMEGPTPVSALIHAATMVTAGVFLLCRLSPLYIEVPDVLNIVAIVGALTAIFAATVGLTQRDIKRVIAYSTCSQLGYMFFAIGVGAPAAAMFHLTTHAFFKALLFLGAGSVIHGMHHEQDLFRMGGLRKALPVTYGLMWAGSLALAGIPPFAGFFSKDLIIESAFAHGSYGIWAIGVLAAFLTAFYSFRVLFRAFDGPAHHHHHAHESPASMLIPMLPLGLGAVGAGWLLSSMGHAEWWQGAIKMAEHAEDHIPFLALHAPLILAPLGIALAYYFFVLHQSKAKTAAQMFDIPYAISFNKWYVDELYNATVVKPTGAISRFAATWLDKRGIDFIVNQTAKTALDFGRFLRPSQTGYVYHYAFAMMLGLVIGLGWLLWRSM